MRVKTLLTHSSSILYIGFFKNNDEEHFYTLANNGELKEWLLNSDGSITPLETCYLLRPGSEYLDYICRGGSCRPGTQAKALRRNRFHTC